MRITGVDCHILLDPGYERDATSSNQDDIVVEVHTDEGITGIGETDLNAWVARECIEAPGMHTMDLGLGQTLIGMDPLDPVKVWDKLYVGTAMTGRRGAVVHALGAIDMALWDICGKAAGVPTWQLLGEKARDSFRPYASLLPKVDGGFDEFSQTLIDQASWAKGLGFTAAKLEILITGPYAHSGLDIPDGRMIETIAGVRRAVGTDFTIMVDVAYAWTSVDRALEVIESWADLDVFFVETPLWADDLEGYAELARRSPTRIAAGEWLATRFEFIDLMDRGGVQVAQPDVGRVGGAHGGPPGLRPGGRARPADRPPRLEDGDHRGGDRASRGGHSAHALFEYVPQQVAESRLRRELVTDELVLVDGELALPGEGRAGVELNRDVLDEFEQAAESVRR